MQTLFREFDRTNRRTIRATHARHVRARGPRAGRPAIALCVCAWGGQVFVVHDEAAKDFQRGVVDWFLAAPQLPTHPLTLTRTRTRISFIDFQ